MQIKNKTIFYWKLKVSINGKDWLDKTDILLQNNIN